MKAQFIVLDWKRGTPKHLVQGVKGNNRPHRALYGGNGSFMVMGTPSKLTLFVRTEENQIIQKNILHEIMNFTNRSRMSDKLYDTLLKICKNTTFEVSEQGEIDISPILNEL